MSMICLQTCVVLHYGSHFKNMGFLLAGVALLRERGSQSHLSDDCAPAPDSLLQEASYLHSYAVAAYTVGTFVHLAFLLL